jgi:hypothetical protein
MRRGEAYKPLRERGQWMRLSERAVFYALLERSDNGDCTIPAHMTPSLLQLAEACCCSKSTVQLAVDHLAWHGWLHRERQPGRGHKTAYQLLEGFPCLPGCEKRKGTDSRTVSGEKGTDSRHFKGTDSRYLSPGKGTDSPSQNPRSDPVSDEGKNEGIGEGGKREGTLAPNRVRCVSAAPVSPAAETGETLAASGGDAANGRHRRSPPDWLLIRQITRIVHQAPGGGLHREELAETVGLDTGSPLLREALMIAYKQRQIDFIRQYAVKPERRTP